MIRNPFSSSSSLLLVLLITTTMFFLFSSTSVLFFSSSSPTSVRFVQAAATTTSSSPLTIPSPLARRRGAFYGALIADALALATHYEYDAKKIKNFYGKIDRYFSPGEKTGGMTHGIGWGARQYHGGNGNGPAKRRGEQTDYGDYNLVTLAALAEKVKKTGGGVSAPGQPLSSRLTIDDILPVWKHKMRTWRSWICTQSRLTLQQVAQGVPSNRLGGNSNAPGLRQAAAFAAYSDEEDLVAVARNAMFTHREQSAHEANEFWTRVVSRIISKNMTPREAIISVRNDPGFTSSFIKQKINQAISKVKEATDGKSQLSKEEFADDLALTSMARLWEVGKSEPIKVGKASPAEGTVPGSIYFILKYENDFAAAVSANAEVGGDCASRAIAIGMVMGAHLGFDEKSSSFPKSWIEGLVEREEAEKLFNTLPLVVPELENENRNKSSEDL